MSWDLIVGSTTYSLDNVADVFLSAYDGLGMPPVENFFDEAAQEDGGEWQGYRLRRRVIQLVIGSVAETQAVYWPLRAKLLRLLRPRAAAMNLRKTLPSGSVRQIDVRFDSGLTIPSRDWEAGIIRTGVNLVSEDPTFYDPNQLGVEFGIVAGMTVPTPVPTPINKDGEFWQVVNYLGDAESYPVVRFWGPLTTARLDQFTTGEYLELNTTLLADEYIEVDCRQGYKTVKGQTGALRRSALTRESDLATFHLAANEDGGTSLENVFKATGSGMTAGVTKIQLMYSTRFMGA